MWLCDPTYDLTYDLTHLSLLTYHLGSKTNINPTLVASCRCYWLTTLVARCGHHQVVYQHNKISTNIPIIFIDAIYKEFYECWSSRTLIAKLYLKPMRAWLSFSLTYQLIAVPLPSQSGGWVREALGYQRTVSEAAKRWLAKYSQRIYFLNINISFFLLIFNQSSIFFDSA